jgi:signal transduction histidine kinase
MVIHEDSKSGDEGVAAAASEHTAALLHDLRNLLTPALLLTERLQGHADPGVRKTADRLAQSLDRAVALLAKNAP